MINAAQLRHDYPEFGDAVLYPDAMVNFYLTWAVRTLNPCRWGASAYAVWPTNPVTTVGTLEIYDLATELVVAHSLALSVQAQEEAANGAPPGLSKGMLTSESVDKASAGYDTASASEKDGGFWNLTRYGIQYLRWKRMAGAGGLYVGIGTNPGPWNGPAWPGPWPFPSPTGFCS